MGENSNMLMYALLFMVLLVVYAGYMCYSGRPIVLLSDLIAKPNVPPAVEPVEGAVSTPV